MNLLLKITELVDKDVAANNKPLSLLGMVIPMLPIMLISDGPPLESQPVLGAVALSASIGWGAFVGWRVFRHTKKELIPYHKSLGATRFWVLMGGHAHTDLRPGSPGWLDGALGRQPPSR